MRTREVIEAELDEWKRRKFNIDMIDHWTDEDRKYNQTCMDNIRRLEKELEDETV